MLDFKPVSISALEWARPFLRAENSRSADYTFGNIYMWNDIYKPQLARAGDRLVTKMIYRGKPFFAFPVGSGDIRPAIDAMREVADADGVKLAIRGMTYEHLTLLNEAYPGVFTWKECRDSFDYLYTVAKLSTYSGKKLHGKRNHCNRFEKENTWDFVPLTRALFPECIAMLDQWLLEFEGDHSSVENERRAILRAFDEYETLGLEGGVLRIDGGRVIGFSVGERANDDTYDVHFEKAFASINGAYPMVCREFARQISRVHPDIAYLNREEDMGLENLRKAKNEFYPDIMIEKFTTEECPYD